MKDDLTKFAPAFKSLAEDMSRLRFDLQPNYISGAKQFVKSFESISLKHLELKNAIERSGLATSHINGLVEASQHWQEMIGEVASVDSAIKTLSLVHGSWHEGINIGGAISQDIALQLKNISTLQLTNIAFRATIAENIFAGINFEVIQEMTRLPELVLAQLQEAINKMTFDYGVLAESIKGLSGMVTLPSYSLPGATREMFLAGYTLQAICPEEEEQDKVVISEQLKEIRQETANCSSLLYSIDPALVALYTGAKNALIGDNEDKARHVMASLRELWNHLLRLIAPDDEVIPWAFSADRSYIHEGRPTRRARIIYICRSLNHDPLTEFISQDTKALIKMMEVFNRIHELRSNLTDEQLQTLILRSDSWITYLVQIYNDGA